MSKKETFLEKIDAELDVVHDKLTKFKTQGVNFSNEVRSDQARHARDLEQKLDQVKARLYDLEKADEHVWEQLKDSIEDVWTTLQSTLEDAVARFNEEKSPPKSSKREESQ